MLAAKPRQKRSGTAQTRSGNLVYMMNTIMKAGVVSAAMAAAALLTQTATAAPINATVTTKVNVEKVTKKANGKKVVITTRKTVHAQPTNYKGHKANPRGLTKYERQQAVRKCSAAIQHRTDRAFPGRFGTANYKFQPTITQIGPSAVRVKGPVKVTGPRASATVASNCVVQRGQISRLNFDAQKARQKVVTKQRNQRYSQNQHGWR